VTWRAKWNLDFSQCCVIMRSVWSSCIYSVAPSFSTPAFVTGKAILCCIHTLLIA